MNPPHVQTKGEIMALLERARARPRKRLGQHFLIDGNLMRRLVDVAELTPSDVVLEVGGGTGGLTDLLASRVASVVCVELDRRLFGILEDRFKHLDHVHRLCVDILETKHRLAVEVRQALQSCATREHGSVKLVANLPYQVATPLLMNLLVETPQVRRFCMTVQAEVGERIAAQPGCKAYGPLSIVCQSLCRIETVASIPPEAFWPRPAVRSVLMRLTVGSPPLADRDELRRFVALVRVAFEQRRKTLGTALRRAVSKEQWERVRLRYDTKRRPEALSVDEWLELFQAM